ncbi:hypothetical protein BVV20_01345 [Xanthomonas oryzae pv. oryzae]|nr:hypothetical protein BVV20_01345 [Xanthomonas oryzae pv. oryzae]
MICSSEKRFFTSNLLGLGNWTPSRCATQTRGDVAPTDLLHHGLTPESSRPAAGPRLSTNIAEGAY